MKFETVELRDVEAIFEKKNGKRSGHSQEKMLDSYGNGSSIQTLEPTVVFTAQPPSQFPEPVHIVEDPEARVFLVANPQERQYYMDKILTLHQEDEGLRRLTLDEACEILREHGMRLLRYFPTLDEDIVQDALVAILPYLKGEKVPVSREGRVRPIGNFNELERYFNRAVVNKRTDALRERQREQRREVSYNANPVVEERIKSEPEPVPENRYFYVGIRSPVEVDEVMQRFRRLKPLAQTVMKLKAEGLTDERVGAIIGKSAGAVGQIVYRTMNRLSPNRERRPKQKLSDEELIDRYRVFLDNFQRRSGREPNSSDVKKAQKLRLVGFTDTLLLKRFGNGKWSEARERLELLISEQLHES